MQCLNGPLTSRGLAPALAKNKPTNDGMPCSPPLCMCFFCGFGAGWYCCASQLPEPFFGIFSYVHAIKIITWDYAGTIQAIQRITGIPTYSASIGIVFGWRWYHLEGTKLCFGHIFGQCLAGILSTINFFGGSRVSGFLDVFPASYGICDCHLLPLLA